MLQNFIAQHSKKEQFSKKKAKIVVKQHKKKSDFRKSKKYGRITFVENLWKVL